ncbi:MAG: ATP-binding protein [Atopobiaceae bacterium]|nr:ATP-binding protein [Atopobiaceae bacterium]
MSVNSSDLTGFVASMGGERALRVEESLGAGYVRLRVAEAERRQAKHDIRSVEDIVIELLRNSRDAGSRHIYVATSKVGNIRTITILDDGSGIPSDMQQKIFEARVTSKLESVHMDRWGVHGRGMALYSIKENAESAKVIYSSPGLGSVIQVVVDITKIPERADQSTWPTCGNDEEGIKRTIKGPHNIIRTCCDFALEAKGSCEVMLGSAAEIAATARQRISQSIDVSDLLFSEGFEAVPVLERFRAAADASELSDVCNHLGLSLSDRTAHRIISEQIKPLRSVFAQVNHYYEPVAKSHEIDLFKDHRGLKISKEDIHGFSRKMERSFSELSEKYYVSLSSEPRIRVSKNKIVVTFDIESQE